MRWVFKLNAFSTVFVLSTEYTYAGVCNLSMYYIPGMVLWNNSYALVIDKTQAH